MEILVPEAKKLEQILDNMKSIQNLVSVMDEKFLLNSDLVQGDPELQLCHERMVMSARRLLQYAVRQEKIASFYLGIFKG